MDKEGINKASKKTQTLIDSQMLANLDNLVTDFKDSEVDM